MTLPELLAQLCPALSSASLSGGLNSSSRVLTAAVETLLGVGAEYQLAGGGKLTKASAPSWKKLEKGRAAKQLGSIAAANF